MKSLLHRSVRIYKTSFSGLSHQIWLLSLVTLINRSGTMVIPFLSVYATHSKGFSLTEAGIIMAAFGGGSLLGSFLGGYLTDRIGYYKVMLGALFFGGLMFIGLQYMEQLWTICLWVFCLTSIADTFRPANFVAIALYSKAENRTRAFSLIRLAINLGFSVGPALGGYIILKLGYSYLFWLDGLTCIFAALFLLLALPEKEQPLIQKATEADGHIQSPYTDKGFLAFIATLFLVSLVFLQLFSTVPAFFRGELHLTEDVIGYILALNGLIIAILEMPLIYILEQRYSIINMMILGSVLIGGGFFMFIFSSFPMLAAVLAIVLLTFGEILHLPFANTFAVQYTTEFNRGKYMSVYTMTWSLAHIFGPFSALALADAFGYDVLWVSLLILCLLAAIGLGMIGRRPQWQPKG